MENEETVVAAVVTLTTDTHDNEATSHVLVGDGGVKQVDEAEYVGTEEVGDGEVIIDDEDDDEKLIKMIKSDGDQDILNKMTELFKRMNASSAIVEEKPVAVKLQTIKFEKNPIETYGMNVKKLKQWSQVRSNKLMNEEAYKSDVAISRVKGFMIAINKAILIQAWYRMTKDRRKFKLYLLGRKNIKRRYYKALKQYWKSEKLYIHHIIGKPIQAWRELVEDEKRLQVIVKDFFLLCIKRLRLTPQGVMAFFSPVQYGTIISETDLNKIRRLILVKLFHGWAAESRRLKIRRFAGSQALSRVMRKIKGPLWIKEINLVCFHIWRRYVAIRIAYRKEEPEPRFTNPFLPQWAKLLQVLTLKRVKKKRAADNAIQLVTKRIFRRWQYVLTLDRSKSLTPLAIAENFHKINVYRSILIGWAGIIRERGAIVRVRTRCFYKWKKYAPLRSRMSKLKLAVTTWDEVTRKRKCFGAMIALCFDIISVHATSLKRLRMNLSNRKVLVCACALLNKQENVIYLDCWRRLLLWYRSRIRWKAYLWQNRYLWYSMRARTIIHAWRQYVVSNKTITTTDTSGTNTVANCDITSSEYRYDIVGDDVSVVHTLETPSVGVGVGVTAIEYTGLVTHDMMTETLHVFENVSDCMYPTCYRPDTPSLHLLLRGISAIPTASYAVEEKQLNLQRCIDNFDILGVAECIASGSYVLLHHIQQVARLLGAQHINMLCLLLSNSPIFIAVCITRSSKYHEVMRCCDPIKAMLIHEHIDRWEGGYITIRELRIIDMLHTVAVDMNTCMNSILTWRATALMLMSKKAYNINLSCNIISSSNTSSIGNSSSSSSSSSSSNIDVEVIEILKRKRIDKIIHSRGNIERLLHITYSTYAANFHVKPLDTAATAAVVVTAAAGVVVDGTDTQRIADGDDWVRSYDIYSLLEEYGNMLGKYSSEATSYRTPVMARDATLITNGFIKQARADFLLLRESLLTAEERLEVQRKVNGNGTGVGNKKKKRVNGRKKRGSKKSSPKKSVKSSSSSSNSSSSSSTSAVIDNASSSVAGLTAATTDSNIVSSSGVGSTDTSASANGHRVDAKQYMSGRRYEVTDPMRCADDIIDDDLYRNRVAMTERLDSTCISSVLLETWTPITSVGTTPVSTTTTATTATTTHSTSGSIIETLTARLLKEANKAKYRILNHFISVTCIPIEEIDTQEYVDTLSGLGGWCIVKSLHNPNFKESLQRGTCLPTVWFLCTHMIQKVQLECSTIEGMIAQTDTTLQSYDDKVDEITSEIDSLEAYVDVTRKQIIRIACKRQEKRRDDDSKRHKQGQQTGTYSRKIFEYKAMIQSANDMYNRCQLLLSSGNFIDVIHTLPDTLIPTHEKEQLLNSSDVEAVRQVVYSHIELIRKDIPAHMDSIVECQQQLDSIDYNAKVYDKICYKSNTLLRNLAEARLNTLIDVNSIIQSGHASIEKLEKMQEQDSTGRFTLVEYLQHLYTYIDILNRQRTRNRQSSDSTVVYDDIDDATGVGIVIGVDVDDVTMNEIEALKLHRRRKALLQQHSHSRVSSRPTTASSADHNDDVIGSNSEGMLMPSSLPTVLPMVPRELTDSERALLIDASTSDSTTATATATSSAYVQTAIGTDTAVVLPTGKYRNKREQTAMMELKRRQEDEAMKIRVLSELTVRITDDYWQSIVPPTLKSESDAALDMLHDGSTHTAHSDIYSDGATGSGSGGHIEVVGKTTAIWNKVKRQVKYRRVKDKRRQLDDDDAINMATAMIESSNNVLPTQVVHPIDYSTIDERAVYGISSTVQPSISFSIDEHPDSRPATRTAAGSRRIEKVLDPFICIGEDTLLSLKASIIHIDSAAATNAGDGDSVHTGDGTDGNGSISDTVSMQDSDMMSLLPDDIDGDIDVTHRHRYATGIDLDGNNSMYDDDIQSYHISDYIDSVGDGAKKRVTFGSISDSVTSDIICSNVNADTDTDHIDGPIETPTDTPIDTPTDTPIDTPTDTPTDTPIDTPTDIDGSISIHACIEPAVAVDSINGDADALDTKALQVQELTFLQSGSTDSFDTASVDSTSDEDDASPPTSIPNPVSQVKLARKKKNRKSRIGTGAGGVLHSSTASSSSPVDSPLMSVSGTNTNTSMMVVDTTRSSTGNTSPPHIGGASPIHMHSNSNDSDDGNEYQLSSTYNLNKFNVNTAVPFNRVSLTSIIDEQLKAFSMERLKHVEEFIESIRSGTVDDVVGTIDGDSDAEGDGDEVIVDMSTFTDTVTDTVTTTAAAPAIATATQTVVASSIDSNANRSIRTKNLKKVTLDLITEGILKRKDDVADRMSYSQKMVPGDRSLFLSSIRNASRNKPHLRHRSSSIGTHRSIGTHDAGIRWSQHNTGLSGKAMTIVGNSSSGSSSDVVGEYDSHHLHDSSNWSSLLNKDSAVISIKGSAFELQRGSSNSSSTTSAPLDSANANDDVDVDRYTGYATSHSSGSGSIHANSKLLDLIFSDYDADSHLRYAYEAIFDTTVVPPMSHVPATTTGIAATAATALVMSDDDDDGGDGGDGVAMTSIDANSMACDDGTSIGNSVGISDTSSVDAQEHAFYQHLVRLSGSANTDAAINSRTYKEYTASKGDTCNDTDVIVEVPRSSSSSRATSPLHQRLLASPTANATTQAIATAGATDTLNKNKYTSYLQYSNDDEEILEAELRSLLNKQKRYDTSIQPMYVHTSSLKHMKSSIGASLPPLRVATNIILESLDVNSKIPTAMPTGGLTSKKRSRMKGLFGSVPTPVGGLRDKKFVVFGMKSKKMMVSSLHTSSLSALPVEKSKLLENSYNRNNNVISNSGNNSIVSRSRGNSFDEDIDVQSLVTLSPVKVVSIIGSKKVPASIAADMGI